MLPPVGGQTAVDHCAGQVERSQRVEIGVAVRHQPDRLVTTAQPLANPRRMMQDGGRRRRKLPRAAIEVMVQNGQRLAVVSPAGASHVGGQFIFKQLALCVVGSARVAFPFRGDESRAIGNEPIAKLHSGSSLPAVARLRMGNDGCRPH